ncbi:MAG: MBL fold metallo-hydrolase [Phycisphaerales bacterium]
MSNPPENAGNSPVHRHGPVEIEVFTLGPFETNCMVVWPAGGAGERDRPEGERECVVVDAGMGAERMLKAIRSRGARVTAIILTHAHMDHIAGVGAIKSAFPEAPIMIHEAEREWLTNPQLNLSMLGGFPVTAPPADRLLKEGEIVEIFDVSHSGGSGERAVKFEVRHTPGHSPGGITLVVQGGGVALVGDALFAGSIGRTNFPGSDFETLERSICEKLYTLPEETVIFPGHGPTSTIGREKRSNPFVRG